MQPNHLKEILNQVADSRLSIDEALDRLKHFAFEDLQFARVDHHRPLRRGQPEVIFAPGKTIDQIIAISRSIHEHQTDLLISRIDPDPARVVVEQFPEARYVSDALMIYLPREGRSEPDTSESAVVTVCTAGTGDIPVAEEAATTAWASGCRVQRVFDIGVAGIHRIGAVKDQLVSAKAIVVVAGMEGALASVVGGLVDRPVIAVPTSIGYGASFKGLAALLGMLNSCSPGVVVVNIDNGFGAGMAAAMIARHAT